MSKVDNAFPFSLALCPMCVAFRELEKYFLLLCWYFLHILHRYMKGIVSLCITPIRYDRWRSSSLLCLWMSLMISKTCRTYLWKSVASSSIIFQRYLQTSQCRLWEMDLLEFLWEAKNASLSRTCFHWILWKLTQQNDLLGSPGRPTVVLPCFVESQLCFRF